jgi:hypothetical protein
MTLVVKQDKAFCSAKVGLFGAQIHVLETEHLAHLIEQLGL